MCLRSVQIIHPDISIIFSPRGRVTYKQRRMQLEVRPSMRLLLSEESTVSHLSGHSNNIPGYILSVDISC